VTWGLELKAKLLISINVAGMLGEITQTKARNSTEGFAAFELVRDYKAGMAVTLQYIKEITPPMQGDLLGSNSVA